MRLIAGAPQPPVGAYDADIVILSLGRVAETLAAIGSALTQTGVTRHLVVVDQGSTAPDLARLAAVIAGRVDATLIRLDHNHGVAGGRNRGSAFGHGRVIAALDNDAEFATPDTLSRMVAALDAEPGLAAIGCRILNHATGDDDLTSWGYPRNLLPCSAEAFDAVTFVGAGHAIRREAWDDAGGYDEALFFCWEEFDLSLRAIARGWRVRYRGDIAVRHKVSAEHRVCWTQDRWFHFVRNRLYVAHKHGAGWASLAPRMAGYLMKGVRNGMGSQTLRAIRAAYGLSTAVPRASLPWAAQDYLRRNDAMHRGGWLRRLRAEVLAVLPAPPGLDGRKARLQTMAAPAVSPHMPTRSVTMARLRVS